MVGIDGLILAGGRATRMGGGDKTLLPVGGRPILARLVATCTPQVDRLLISANGDATRLLPYGLPVIADSHNEAGPLAGILAGLEWCASNRPDTTALVTVPGDTPFVPTDLVQRLWHARGDDRPIVLAASRQRLHPTVGLWPIALRAQLAGFLTTSRRRSVQAFAEQLGYAIATFPAEPYDPFLNVNTPDDLTAAEAAAALAQDS